MVIAQEDGDGTRTLNEAVRVFPAGRGRPPEQLGWPEVEVRYRPGTRHPESAVLHMRTRPGPSRSTSRSRRSGSSASTAAPGTAATPTGPTGSGAGGVGPRASWSTSRPRHHGSDPLRGRRPRGPGHLRRSRGVGHVRARDLRPAPPVGLHRVGVGGSRDGLVSDGDPTAATTARGWPRRPRDPGPRPRDHEDLHRRLADVAGDEGDRPRGLGAASCPSPTACRARPCCSSARGAPTRPRRGDGEPGLRGTAHPRRRRGAGVPRLRPRAPVPGAATGGRAHRGPGAPHACGWSSTPTPSARRSS